MHIPCARCRDQLTNPGVGAWHCALCNTRVTMGYTNDTVFQHAYVRANDLNYQIFHTGWKPRYIDATEQAAYRLGGMGAVIALREAAA